MIVNKKTFYAVGQGGFYSERIWNDGEVRTIIYDCGSVTTMANNHICPLNRCINESGLEKIDYVVVSHLDNDHINGLKALDNYGKKINPNWNPVIILPKPNPIDLLLFYKTASRSAIDYYLGRMSCMRQLHVSDENFDEEINLDDDWGEVKSISHNCRVFAGFKKCKEKWLLKFYVDTSKYQKKLTKRDLKVINSVNTFSDFELKKKKLTTIYKSYKEKLRKLKILRKKQGMKNKGDSSEMNLSSMAMISAPCNEEMRNRNCERGLSIPYVSWLNGDIRLKNEQEMLAIEKHFKEFLSLNIDFQMPHHGSQNNFERLPNVHRRIRTYIWAGEDNDYGHPDGTTLKKLINAGVEINWITEMCKNIIRYEIWI